MQACAMQHARAHSSLHCSTSSLSPSAVPCSFKRLSAQHQHRGRGLQSKQQRARPALARTAKILPSSFVLRAVPPQQEENKQQEQKEQKQGSEAGQESRPTEQRAQKMERADVDDQLAPLWQDIKRELKKDADPELSQLLDEVSYEELMQSDNNGLFKRLADAKLGPYMAAMGLNSDPLAFFSEVIKLALFLQFVTCGFLFYGMELLGHFDTGDALRATAGMTLGYTSRPFYKMEALLYPIYNAVLKAVLPDAVFEVPAGSREAVSSTINSIGITLAAAFIIPQLLGLSVDDSTLLAAPITLGWLLFDATYMTSLYLVIQRDAPEDS